MHISVYFVSLGLQVMLDLKDPPSSMSLISARASARTNGKYMIDVCVSPFYSNMLAQQGALA